MVIEYEKQAWADGSGATPLSAERLNHIEAGIKASADAADAVTPLLADGGRLSEAGLTAAFVESGNIPVSYTWDAATGFIASATEHYPAPIGDRVTTYSAYGEFGPTHEEDPDGGGWTLTYDSAGNPTGREEA